SFVVAPRQRTKAVNLEGKSFLHSYEWKNDPGFSILELIMTAPMVVTSWINLQYYGSTVDNKTFGSGNKTLHNVTAGLGVLEGYSGDLRVGLPWQAIHDGEKYQHQPEKLTVVIEAPIEAINVILSKHQSVRDLVDNGWIYLMVMNEEGKVTHKYSGGLQWDSIAQAAA
ncbi:MAG: putative inorganic carbon transporter subunit DabA, partial [Algoriphagus sp.]|uniref:putative inorganic carbon transporter subunit DabA n=1 Tax=Algoriphagus sp. TaxID=1872435 RepID=UPI003296DF82